MILDEQGLTYARALMCYLVAQNAVVRFKSLHVENRCSIVGQLYAKLRGWA